MNDRAPNPTPKTTNHIGEILIIVGFLLMAIFTSKTERDNGFGAATNIPFIYLGFFLFTGGIIKALYDHFMQGNLIKFLAISIICLMIVFVIAANMFHWL